MVVGSPEYHMISAITTQKQFNGIRISPMTMLLKLTPTARSSQEKNQRRDGLPL
jgi:hypothetical protein